jgi:hypothetical protein
MLRDCGRCFCCTYSRRKQVRFLNLGRIGGKRQERQKLVYGQWNFYGMYNAYYDQIESKVTSTDLFVAENNDISPLGLGLRMSPESRAVAITFSIISFIPPEACPCLSLT